MEAKLTAVVLKSHLNDSKEGYSPPTLADTGCIYQSPYTDTQIVNQHSAIAGLSYYEAHYALMYCMHTFLFIKLKMA